MSDPLRKGNFDTYLFELFIPSHINDQVVGYCLSTVECYIDGILSDIIYDRDHENIMEAMCNPINEVVNKLVNSAAVDIMTIPEEYDPDVVEYFNNDGEGFYILLYMSFLKVIDGSLRYLPYLIEKANQNGTYYDDFRLTRGMDALILRLIRSERYGQ